MLHRGSAPSHLPSLIMPCPYCGHRMVVTSIAPTSSDPSESEFEDVTHACRSCGTELIRTVSPESKVA
jgi:DNA-directed RNA polymerase subunit RPC12/RpoP